MANRKLPFGYEMQQGIVCIKTAEAAIVKEIYVPGRIINIVCK